MPGCSCSRCPAARAERSRLGQEDPQRLGHETGNGARLVQLELGGDAGLAAQVLVKLGADLNRVRQQVIQLLHGYQGKDSLMTVSAAGEYTLGSGVQTRLDAVERRLAAVEQRVGAGPDTSDLDDQIDRVRRERHDAADAQEYERAAELRDREKELLASKSAQQEQWTAAHPALPDLAEQWQQLAGEIERLSALLRQHGIDPQDKPA